MRHKDASAMFVVLWTRIVSSMEESLQDVFAFKIVMSIYSLSKDTKVIDKHIV